MAPIREAFEFSVTEISLQTSDDAHKILHGNKNEMLNLREWQLE